MKYALFFCLSLLLLPFTADAQLAPISGFCEGGNQTVSDGSGFPTTPTVQGSYPSCTVTVKLTGTSTLATLYSTSTGTTLTNPFTATSSGSWIFYTAVNQGYDVVMSGGTAPNTFPSPVTLAGLFPTLIGSIPTIEGWGSQLAWKANGCPTPACAVGFQTPSLVDRSFMPHQQPSVPKDYTYLAVPNLSTEVGISGRYNGDLITKQINQNSGFGMDFEATTTHLSNNFMSGFSYNYTQTFGNNNNDGVPPPNTIPLNPRDNTSVFGIYSTMAGGQNGGTLTVNSNNYSHGDNVLLTVNGVGSGMTNNDEEGDPEFLRGGLGTNLSRFTATLTGTPTANSTTKVYDVPVPSNWQNNLGIGNFLLNTSNTSTVDVDHIDTCGNSTTNPKGYICLTFPLTGAGAPTTSTFSSKFATASTMQLIVFTTLQGQVTVLSNPLPGDTVTVHGTTINFVTTPTTGRVTIGATVNATAVNLQAFLTANVSGYTYDLQGNTISINSSSTGDPHLSQTGTPQRFVLSAPGQVSSIDATEVATPPIQTVVPVSHASLVTAPVCLVANATVVVASGSDFQLATVLATDTTNNTVTLATWDAYGNLDGSQYGPYNSMLSCGGPAGYGVEMTVDDIPTGQVASLLGYTPYNNSNDLRPRMHPIVGSDGTNLFVWSPVTTDFNTRGLYKRTVPIAPTIALTITGGALTSGIITQTANQYTNAGTNGLVGSSGENVLMPNPTVTFSTGCTVTPTATVSYYLSANQWFVGIPSLSGGTSAINITNPGSGCPGTLTATLTTIYSNQARFYPLGVVPALAFTSFGNGSYAPQTSSLIANLVSTADWSSGANITSEIVPHSKTALTPGFNLWNTSDAGPLQAGGSWATWNMTGVQAGTTMWQFVNGDNTALFAQPNHPPTSSQYIKVPPIGLQVKGPVTTALQLSAPVTPIQNVFTPGASLISVDCLGYDGGNCFNQAPYSLFNLPNAYGGINSMTFSPSEQGLYLNFPKVASSGFVGQLAALTSTGSNLPVVTVTAGGTATATSGNYGSSLYGTNGIWYMGSFWNGAASQDCWREFLVEGSGSTPTSTLNLSHSCNTGAPASVQLSGPNGVGLQLTGAISQSGTTGTNVFTNATQLPSTTTISGQNICLSSGTNCPTLAPSPLALPTSAIAAGSCSTAASEAVTGVTSSSFIGATPTVDASTVTGYGGGGLTLITFYSLVGGSPGVAVKACNPTAASITPGALTVNIRVIQ